jgi:hypothetical protein
MARKQSLKQGEKILFGITVAFIVVAVIAYAMLEVIRQHDDKPMFKVRTHYDLTAEGREGSALFRKHGCTSCHRAMNNGTNMGLSLDGVGSARTQAWLYDFLRQPEKTYGSATVDHGAPPKEAAYVADIPDEELAAIATFISELKSDQGSSSAPVPPEGRSEFIDNMLKNFAPKDWKEKYQDVRDDEQLKQQGNQSE